MKRKILLISLMIIFILSSIGVAVNASSYDTDLYEEKIFSNATLENDFADNSILVVFNKQETMRFKEYSLGDFAEVNCYAVQNLTISSSTALKEQINRKKQKQEFYETRMDNSADTMEIMKTSLKRYLD